MALHACGDLHTHLLTRVAEGVPGGDPLPVLLPPHQRRALRALSRAARASALRLGKSDLKLPLQETVTGGARIARLREREVVWRLAFDCLQRQVRGWMSTCRCPTCKRAC